MCVVFYYFVTPGHEWKGVSFYFSDLGRPGIIAVRIRCGVVRIHITHGTIAIISIAAKTQAGLPSILSTCLLRFGGRGPSAGLAARRQDFSTPNFDIFFIPFYPFFMLSNTPGLAAPSFRLQRGCACYQGLGRPGRIAVRIRCGVVRIHITHGTIAIISIAAKTQADSIPRV